MSLTGVDFNGHDPKTVHRETLISSLDIRLKSLLDTLNFSHNLHPLYGGEQIFPFLH